MTIDDIRELATSIILAAADEGAEEREDFSDDLIALREELLQHFSALQQQLAAAREELAGCKAALHIACGERSLAHEALQAAEDGPVVINHVPVPKSAIADANKALASHRSKPNAPGLIGRIELSLKCNEPVTEVEFAWARLLREAIAHLAPDATLQRDRQP